MHFTGTYKILRIFQLFVGLMMMIISCLRQSNNITIIGQFSKKNLFLLHFGIFIMFVTFNTIINIMNIKLAGMRPIIIDKA